MRVPGGIVKGSLVSLALVVVACTAAGRATPETTASGVLGIVTGSDARETLAALCELRGSTGPSAAEALFFDRAHERLHEIAAAVEQVDRAAAGRLLEAKERVEAGIGTLPHSFASNMEGLLEATRAGLAELGLPSPGCDV